ncbi:MAG: magnesium transporter [Candidatus Aenigmarchaeota archaeon]|nr:magnesium transporter [Candidatus Aenigmarchaeota archaeon]
MSLFKSIIKQSLPVLLLCIFGEILAGLVVSNVKIYLDILPGILVLVPVVMGTRGNILGIFANRLTTGLHLGTVYMRLRKNPTLSTNLKAAILLSFVIAILSGIMAHYSCIFLGFKSMGLIKFILVSTIASVLSDTSLIFVSVFVSFYSYKNNIDPDNIVIPIITTMSDVISNLFLLLSVKIVMLI